MHVSHTHFFLSNPPRSLLLLPFASSQLSSFLLSAPSERIHLLLPQALAGLSPISFGTLPTSSSSGAIPGSSRSPLWTLLPSARRLRISSCGKTPHCGAIFTRVESPRATSTPPSDFWQGSVPHPDARYVPARSSGIRCRLGGAGGTRVPR